MDPIHEPLSPSKRVPLAVWPCAQTPPIHQRGAYLDHPPQAAHPLTLPDLARRLVIDLSAPGDLVGDLMCGSGATVMEAAAAGRRVVAADIESACLAHTRANLEHALPSKDRPLVEQLWQADARDAADLMEDYLGRLDLIVLGPPGPARPGHTPQVELAQGSLARLAHGGYAAALTDVLAACARLLGPGGRVAVAVPHRHEGGRITDLASLTVACADGAGLDYIQHIIALNTPVGAAGWDTTVPPVPSWGSGHPAVVHHPVHDDVTVFTKGAPSPSRAARAEVMA